MAIPPEREPWRLTDEQIDRLEPHELAEYLGLLEAERVARIEAWTYLPRQQVAEDRITAGVFELLYGGAVGGGKSDWLLHHQYDLALRYPNFRGLLIRRTFPELRRSLIERSWEKFDRDLARYVATDHTWRFKNGSTIEFGYCERDLDVYQYQSAEYDNIGWDELTQFPTSFPYLYLLSRLRTSIAKTLRGLRPHVTAGTNPGGVGGAWVKQRFVDVAPENQPHEVTVEIPGETEPRSIIRCYVPAKLSDNPYINSSAYRSALALLPDDIRRSLEDGSWDVVEGQYFSEWRRHIHVVEPFEIPHWWTRIGGLDYGYANPFCHLWAAFDGDENCYIYREAYETGLTPSMQARRVLGMETPNEHLIYRVADPSIWIRTGAGPPIAQQYAEAGLIFRKANNARIDGWARVRERLRVDEVTGKPTVFVFSTCTNLIRTLPLLVYDKTKPEDLNTDGEDHAADTLRYLLMSRPNRSRRPDPKPSTMEERMAERHQKRRRDRERGVMDHPVLGRLER